MRYLPSRLVFAVGILSAVCQSSFAAQLYFNATASSLNGVYGSNPGNYYVFGHIHMPGTGYKMISAGGGIGLSADGNGSQFSAASFTSWDALVAAETGQWTLITNPGLFSETTYFFDVGLGDINPQPIWVDAYRIAGTPADQTRVEFSGPIDSPYTLFYSASSPGGFVSQQYALASGQSFIDLTIPVDFTSLYLGAVRSTPTSAFSFSTPTTTDGVALPDWAILPFTGYAENGVFLSNGTLRSVSVPDSTCTLVLLLGSFTGLAAVRRTARRG
jgi:hypothetical protein